MVFAPADKPYPADISRLTPLRFYAAVIVIVFHYMHAPFPIPVWNYTGMLSKVHLCVDFFFILSGFVLSHVYLADFEAGKFSMRAYYVKRVARIYPLHLFTLAVGVALVYWAVAMGSPHYTKGFPYLSYVPQQLLLIHAWGVDEGLIFNKAAWSISAEWFVYLLFPLMLFGLRRVPDLLFLAGCLALFAGLFIWWEYHWWRPITEVTYDYGHIRAVPEFLLGMALYRFGRRWKLKYCGRALCGIVGASIFVMCHFKVSDIIIVPTIAFLIFMTAEQARRGMTGWMTAKFPVYMGEASYSIYMAHYLIFDPLFVTLIYPILAPVMTFKLLMILWFGMYPVVFIFSLFLFEFVEKPGRSWITKKFAGRKKAGPEAPEGQPVPPP